MRPIGPVLRLPQAVVATPPTRRRRPAGLVVALALALGAVVPASGAAPPAQPDHAPQVVATQPAAPRHPTPGAAPAAAATVPGTTSLVSAAANDGFAGGPSSMPSISENGRWVAFVSSAPNLVANDTNQAAEVFLRDRREGTTVRVTLPNGRPIPGGASASEPSISADGSVVAFTYVPPTTAPPQPPTVPPTPSPTPSPTPAIILLAVTPCTGSLVIVWHRETGESEIASITPDGGLACGSTAPSVSGDGRRVAFVQPTALNAAGLLVPQVFYRDLPAGTTSLVSGVGGAVANGASRAPAISADGRVVAFESDASNLAAGDAPQQTDVFARTIPNGPMELISVGSGAAANGPSRDPAISANGSMVAFESSATNLAPGAGSVRNVYVRDRAVGRTRLVSLDASGAAAGGDSGQAAISADGTVVAFASLATDLAAGGIVPAAALPASPAEVYAHDLVTGHTIRVSEARGGGPAGQFNLQPTVAANGRLVAFASTSPNLVRGDGNQVSDIFLRDSPPAAALAPDPVDFGARAIGADGLPVAAVLTNVGWGRLRVSGVDRSGPAAADFAIAFNACEGRVLRLSESCTITLTFAPGGTGDRNATLVVDHNGLRPPASVALHGSGSSAKVEIEPPVGRPGVVVIATGSGFPPNQEVTLTWSRGISPRLPPIVTDARGSFRVQVLIFHNDLVGPRDLVVAPVGRAAFPPFGTAFLVVEPPSEPPRFEPGDPATNQPKILVFRR